MRVTNIIIAITLLFVSNLSHAVVIEGREWRQLTDTTRLSWYEVSTVCPEGGGTCNGSIGGVDFTDWNWASPSDVAKLFTFYNPRFTSPFLREANSAWAPLFFNDFNPVVSNSTVNSAFGWTNESFTDSAGGLRGGIAIVQDIFDIERLDTMSQTNARAFGRNFGQGVWLYRSDTVDVPEPSTYWIMSLGLLGLVFTLRRKKP